MGPGSALALFLDRLQLTLNISGASRHFICSHHQFSLRKKEERGWAHWMQLGFLYGVLDSCFQFALCSCPTLSKLEVQPSV